MSDEDPKSESAVADVVWYFTVAAFFLVVATVLALNGPDQFSRYDISMEWFVVAAYVFGAGFLLSGMLRLYALRTKKLGASDTDAFVLNALATGIFGALKWGFYALLALGAYLFFIGPFASLSLADQLLLGGMLVIIAFVWEIRAMLIKLLNRSS